MIQADRSGSLGKRLLAAVPLLFVAAQVPQSANAEDDLFTRFSVGSWYFGAGGALGVSALSGEDGDVGSPSGGVTLRVGRRPYGSLLLGDRRLLLHQVRKWKREAGAGHGKCPMDGPVDLRRARPVASVPARGRGLDAGATVDRRSDRGAGQRSLSARSRNRVLPVDRDGVANGYSVHGP